ncbi:cyclin-A3-2-like [Euphorbia lathyris]|uniref:cyclin-A3-2-like n=1 Tax=Euphorbia lathyris TaxID=212925 RepID=UPI003313A714
MEKPLSKEKKRVVLGDLPNLSNALVLANVNPSAAPLKQITKAKPKAKSPILPNKDDVSKLNASKNDTDDPQICRVYESDIYQYLHKLEADPKKRPLPDHIETVQKDVTVYMRGILVDWLVEVAEEYKLLSDTLYMTISYIDRFLSLNVVNRKKLQLLGVSSMLIVAKYEEINPPDVQDFCYITDNTFTKEEIVKMEADILKSLKFELGSPTIMTFLRKHARVAQEDDMSVFILMQLEFLEYYLAELSLLDFDCVKFLPSLVAASTIFLARFMIRPKMHPWNSSLEQCTGYRPWDLKECVLIIHDLYLSRRGGELYAVRNKYKHYKFKGMPSSPDIPASFFSRC